MIEDTANAAKHLVNGEQPALGVVANPFSRSVNATPSDGFSRVGDGVLQYTTLSPIERARLTHRQGLGPYDIQNLLDRGFSPQQIEQLQDVTTTGLSTNHRANELAQRLINQGITPTLQSRLNYLQDAYNNGIQIVSDSYGRPITQIEAIRRGIRGTRPASMDYVNQYYGKIGGSDLSHPIYNDPSAYRIFKALDEAIGVFDPQTVAKITPDIKQILESGYDSTKSEEEILSDLKTFFESQNKPFYPGPLERIKASVGNTFTEEAGLHHNPHHK
jgi:hypothetical protein